MADSKFQSATSTQTTPSAAEQPAAGPGQSERQDDESSLRRSWGATIALWLILFTFFVFFGQVVIELIVGLLR